MERHVLSDRHRLSIEDGYVRRVVTLNTLASSTTFNYSSIHPGVRSHHLEQVEIMSEKSKPTQNDRNNCRLMSTQHKKGSTGTWEEGTLTPTLTLTLTLTLI